MAVRSVMDRKTAWVAIAINSSFSIRQMFRSPLGAALGLD